MLFEERIILSLCEVFLMDLTSRIIPCTYEKQQRELNTTSHGKKNPNVSLERVAASVDGPSFCCTDNFCNICTPRCQKNIKRLNVKVIMLNAGI